MVPNTTQNFGISTVSAGSERSIRSAAAPSSRVKPVNSKKNLERFKVYFFSERMTWYRAMQTPIRLSTAVNKGCDESRD